MSNITRSTVDWFIMTMEDHSCVEDYIQLQNEDECIFKITRKGQLPEVNVHLSDAYEYGHMEYGLRPPQIGKGDFILMAAFSGQFAESLVPIALKDRIGIGDMRKLMGALNWGKVWEYKLPETESDH